MKNVFLLLSFALLALSLSAQKPVEVRLIQKAGNQDFTLNTTLSADAGYAYKPSRLQYYVSLPSVIHDGGQVSLASNRYFLVNAAGDVTLDFGEMNVQNIEGVIFSIGVDEERNHLDPSTYPAGHPLAHHNPSMHWGWAAGYRFLAFEGHVGANFIYGFDIHSIGNELFQTITLNTGAEEEDGKLVVTIQADYNKLLQGVDISGGLSSHGNLGPAGTIMHNIGNLVFSPLTPTSVVDETFAPAFSFSLAPNPSQDGFTQAVFDLPAGCYLQISDLAGRTISQQALPEGRSVQPLNAPGPGMYLTRIWREGKPLAAEKWVVVK